MIEGGDPVGEAAVAWVVRLASDQRTRADEEGFRAWMEADAAHAQAFADCSALWTGCRPLLGPMRAARRFVNCGLRCRSRPA